MQFAKGCSGSPAVLIVGPDTQEHARLRAVLDLARRRVLRGGAVQQSLTLLDAASVVICEELLADGGWRDILAALNQMHSPPVLIVTASMADPPLWAEVLNLGGYDGVKTADRTARKQPPVRPFGQQTLDDSGKCACFSPQPAR